LASDAAFKKIHASLPINDIRREVKSGELFDHCCFWIICRHFACSQRWATRAVCPAAVGCSLLFNKLRK